MNLTPHPVHPNLFLTSDGRVFQELTVTRRDGGYASVHLPSNRRTTRLHRLLAETFLPAPAPGQTQTRHLDGDPTNNDLSNLAWGSPSENYADAIMHGRDTRGERNGTARLTLEQAQDVYDRVAAGERGTDLAKEYGISQPTVSGIFHGHYWPEVVR